MWKTPLKKGSIVTCSNGMITRVMSEPVARDDYYLVEVYVIEGGDSCYSTGSTEHFYHCGPERWKVSLFSQIEQGLPTLEEEFFARQTV